MLQNPLAYKYVTIMLLVHEASYYSTRMNLPVTLPVKEQDIKYLVPYPPAIGMFGGRIQVDCYSFTFNDTAHVFDRLDRYGFHSMGIEMEKNESSSSGMNRASQMTYTVATNQVYGLATNWLAAFDVDFQKLSKSCVLRVNSDSTYYSPRGPIRSPILTVEWQRTNVVDSSDYSVSVEMSAVSGELLKMTDGDGSFGKRKCPVINDPDKLAAIANEEFRRYSSLERSNLLFQFTGLHFTEFRCPGVDSPLFVKSNTIPASPSGAKSNPN